MQAARVMVFSVLFFAGTFSAISLLFYFGDWARLIWVASFGLFVGVVAAPEFDRKAFRHPTLMQSVAGGVAGYILAVVLGLSPESTFAVIGLGLMVGASANMWVKHVQI